tara:strand:+ start:6538 stop:6903 length:366 start_codon:yes stop_codon:yes gene_type:complete
MAAIANVELTDTFNGQRIRINNALKRLNNFAQNESLITANTLISNVSLTASGNLIVSGVNSLANLNSTNTNITGGSLLITANTFHSGTIELTGLTGTTANTVAAAINETNDNILAFSIALG